MQVVLAAILGLVLSVGFQSPLDAADWRRGDAPDRPGRDRPEHGDRDTDRPGGPRISVEPYIDLSREPRPNVDEPGYIMAELQGCVAQGIRLFVDCLRPNHGSVMIRRLESCLRSETIPDDPGRVLACLPPASVR